MMKLAAFKINKCGKYINIIKKFLCDSSFLKLVYHMVKNYKVIDTEVACKEPINNMINVWSEKAVKYLKNSSYRIKFVR